MYLNREYNKNSCVDCKFLYKFNCIWGSSVICWWKILEINEIPPPEGMTRTCHQSTYFVFVYMYKILLILANNNCKICFTQPSNRKYFFFKFYNYLQVLSCWQIYDTFSFLLTFSLQVTARAATDIDTTYMFLCLPTGKWSHTFYPLFVILLKKTNFNQTLTSFVNLPKNVKIGIRRKRKI